MKKFFIYLGSAIGLLTITIVIFLFFLFQDIEFGGDPRKDNLERLQNSPHFHHNQFQNTVKERDPDYWVNLKELFDDQQRQPTAKFPLVKPQYTEKPFEGLRAVWFGHASVLVEIEGHRIFFDPVLSEYAFLLKAVAPKRMNPPPLAMTEIPKIDAVIVSHDHYDHLDMKTILHLHEQGASFFVGLGVGSHLRKWGIPDDKINEMDWGDSIDFKGLKVNCTEARHYSGRKSMSKDTLWTSWVVQGKAHSVFHSGDSGYSNHFKQIGQKFPNIDISLIKVGDYGLDLAWQDIHMVPENSIKAHIDLGAKVMIPIHWGVFELSFHDWNEPIERTLKAAQQNEIDLVTPRLGEVVESGKYFNSTTWWRDI